MRSNVETQDKNIMTDEFYNIKNNEYPLFCAKCQTPLPTYIIPEQMFKTMNICPKLIEGDLTSPRRKNSLVSRVSSGK